MRRMMKFGVAAVAAASVAAIGVAWAQPSGHGRGSWGMEQVFGRADADKDGRITRAELDTFAATRFREVDSNNDGGVTLDEFHAYAAREFGRRGGGDDGQGRRAAMFRAFDLNGDGRVTLEEARLPADTMFRAADANADGAVARDEVPMGHGGPRGDRQGPGRPPG